MTYCFEVFRDFFEIKSKEAERNYNVNTRKYLLSLLILFDQYMFVFYKLNFL